MFILVYDLKPNAIIICYYNLNLLFKLLQLWPLSAPLDWCCFLSVRSHLLLSIPLICAPWVIRGLSCILPASALKATTSHLGKSLNPSIHTPSQANQIRRASRWDPGGGSFKSSTGDSNVQLSLKITRLEWYSANINVSMKPLGILLRLIE